MKAKNARRALLMSVLSLFVCVSMLVGTTFAWFTDSVTSANNIIKSGTLDVTMEWMNGTEDPAAGTWTDASTGAIFNYDLWEPGYTEVRHIKIANVGNLALKYQIQILANGEVSDLADVIDVYYVDPAVPGGVTDRTMLDDSNKLGTLSKALEDMPATANGNLLAEEEVTLTIALKMQETAGNEYQNKSIGTDFSIILNATQLTAEIDSFDNQYDADAANPTYSAPVKLPENGPMKVGDDSFEVELPEALVDALRTKLGDPNAPNYVPSLSVAKTGDKYDVVNKTVYFSNVDLVDEKGNVVDLTDNDVPYPVSADVSKVFETGDIVKIYHDGEKIEEVTVDVGGKIHYEATHFCEVAIVESPLVVNLRNNYGYATVQSAVNAAQDRDVLEMRAGYNTTENPLTETITVDKDITLNPNGMYLVSNAPATFTVVEGGKLTVTEGSFTIKNTAANGAAVLVDGGEFVMEGGSFDAHTAVRTTNGKSSTVTLAAGWSNRVTVAFDLKGDDTLNVTGGSLYSSAESVKTVAGNHLTFNMSGGLLSSKTTQYSAAVNLKCPATVNMTGGKIENTYSSGYNGSSAIEVNVAPTTINLSGTATLSSNGVAVMLGSHWDPPAVQEERIVLNMSGNSSISATSQMGFGVRYAQDCCDVILAGNAKINATYQAVQFNTNNYVYTNSTLLVSENATVTSTAGRVGGGYAIASNGHVTVTGGKISGSTAGIASFQEGAVVIIDNSQSGTPITVNKVDIAEGVTYTVAGNPTIG